jgi:hypothetical protein
MYGKELDHAAETSKIVTLIHANSAFCCVLPMNVQWDELVFHKASGQVLFKCSGGLIVHFFKLWFEPTGDWLIVEVVICYGHFVLCSRLHRFFEYGIAVIIVQDEEVLVALARLYWKMSGEVSVRFEMCLGMSSLSTMGLTCLVDHRFLHFWSRCYLVIASKCGR